MNKLVFIELKSGYDNNGPAWICSPDYSKSRRTIYFNGKALKKPNSIITSGNFYDVETGDEYWVSGIKGNGRDRHWIGSGKIMIDRKVVDDYLRFIGQSALKKSKFIVVDLEPTDVSRFEKLENE